MGEGKVRTILFYLKMFLRLSDSYRSTNGSIIREIINGVNRLTSSSNDLATVSQQLSPRARDTADKSRSFAAAIEEMIVNIQSVSAVMEQSSNPVI